LQVRHFYSSQHPAPYTIDRIVRLESTEEQSMMSDGD
jgi:hypothetical protein